MLAGVPEPGDQEVGGAVDDNRFFDEVRSAVHHPEELDDPCHAIQVADLLLETAEAVENYELGRLAGGVDVDVLSDLAAVGVLAVLATRPMARDENQVSGPDCAEVVELRRPRVWHFVTELREALFNLRHVSLPSTACLRQHGVRTLDSGAWPWPGQCVWKLDPLDALSEDSHAARLIVGERMHGVERARMHPDPARSHGPRPSDRLSEQPAAQPLAHEGRQHPEVRDLDVVFDCAVELEVGGRRALEVHHPRLDPRVAQPLQPSLVRPLEAVDPVPVAAGGGIQEMSELGRRSPRPAYVDGAGRLW